MSCIRLTETNEEESLLFNDLLTLATDESQADEFLAYFRTPEFLEHFGDYKKHYSNEFPNKTDEEKSLNERVDINGEPLLKYNNIINKYYYIDKYNEPVFYPPYNQGLNKHLLTNDIKLMAKTMGLSFFESNVDIDFDTLTFTPKNNIILQDFVKTYLNSKIDELNNHSNLDLLLKGASLSNTINNIDEWVSEIKDYFSSINIDNFQLEIDENKDGNELMRIESFLKSNKDSINNNIKLFLSLLKNDELNRFNEYNYIPFDDIYATLNKALSNKVVVINESNELEDLYEIFLDEILKLTESKPYYSILYDKLTAPTVTDMFKNQFVQAFNLYKNNFLTSEVSRGLDGKLTYTVMNVSSVGSRESNILKQWYYNYNKSIPSLGNLKNAHVRFKQIHQEFNSVSRSIKTENDLLPYLANVERVLRGLGVEFTEKGFSYYINNYNEINDVNTKKGVIRDIMYKINKALESQIQTENKSNLFLNQSLFKDLAKSEAFFIEEGSDSSIFTLGKTRWVYSKPSYLDIRVAEWKKDPELLQKHYNSTVYNGSSHYMEFLLALEIEDETARHEARKERINSMEVAIFNSLQESGDSFNGVDTKSLSSVDSLVDYANKILAHHKGQPVYHKTALAADKSTEYQIYYGQDSDFFNINTNASYNSTNKIIELDNSVYEIFYKYYKGEYNRIREEYKFISENDESKYIPNYHTGNKNAFKSQLFPKLSTNSENLVLFDKEGIPLLEDLDQYKPDIIAFIRKELSVDIGKLYNKLQDNGIFDFSSEGLKVNNAIDKDIYNSYLNQGEGTTIDNVFIKIASDIFVNSVISQVEYSKMFSGDIAYYKNVSDYKKRIPSTYTDGLYMRLKDGEQLFNASIIENVDIPSHHLEELKKYLPKSIWKHYSKIDSTDAQAWITPQRWKFIMERTGKFNDVAKRVYNKFQKKNPIFEQDELKLLAQPLKGVYFDISKGKPVFLKYSQAVLLPNMIKGTDLEKLYDKMTKKDGKLLEYKDQIHEVITSSGIKVGSPKPNNTHTDNGSIEIKDELTSFPLHNKSWKLQQDLPTKGIKSTDVGSQIQQIIFQGLTNNLNGTYDLNGETISGTDLVDHINDIVASLSNSGVSNVKRRLGLNENFVIENEDILYDTIIKELKKRPNTPKNMIKALEAKMSPYAIPGATEQFQNIFSSIINSSTVKIKTNGGGYIQMSDYGLSRDEANEQGVIYAPWFNDKTLPPPIKYTDENGIDRLKAGGIFISGSFIAKHIPDYTLMSQETLFGTKEKNYTDGKLDKRILENIIGYRIPNQGLASNDALNILGILPAETGDTVIAYTGITTKTGSDFDIDKMYLMMSSFKAVYDERDINKVIEWANKNLELTPDEIKYELLVEGFDVDVMSSSEFTMDTYVRNIILDASANNSVKDDYFSSENAIKANKLSYDENNDKNKLIEAYKSVLTNIHVGEALMNPIDLPFMQNDSKNLQKDNNEENLNSFEAFSAIDDIILKYEFMLGKAGLGQNVNALKDSVRGSLANIKFNQYYLKWGHADEKGDTYFDAEYSESLTEQEKRQYRKTYLDNGGTLKGFNEVIDKLGKVRLNDTLMALVNSFVDIAKDSYIIKGNWVTQTNDIGFMLIRAGVHPFKVNAFMAQPIIKDYVNFRNNRESKSIPVDGRLDISFKRKQARDIFKSNNGIDINDKSLQEKTITINNRTYTYSNIFNSVVTNNRIQLISDKKHKKYAENKDIFLKAIKESLIEKFKVSDSREDVRDLYTSLIQSIDEVFDSTEIAFNSITLGDLRNQVQVKSDVQTQLAVLKQYEEWLIQAKKLSANIKASRVDTDGKGKNITSLIIANNLIKNILSKELNEGSLLGFRTKLKRNGKDTILNTMVKNSITFPYKIMKANPKFFIISNPKVITTFNQISQYIYGENLQNDRLASQLEKSYYTYLMSNFKPLKLNIEQQRDLLNTLPEELNKLKKDSSIKNELIKELTLNDSDKKNRFYIGLSNLKKAVSFKNTLTDSWTELLETHPEFAEKLIQYSYIVSGFNNSKTQFHQFIPYEWFNKNRFNSYLKQVHIEGDIDLQFIDQFFRNNNSDTRIVKQTFKSESLRPSDGKRSGLKINSKLVPNPSYMVYITKPGPVPDAPDIKLYYKYLSRDNEGYDTYIRTSLLGNKDTKGNRVLEYDSSLIESETTKSSIFKDNLITSNMVNMNLINTLRTTFKYGNKNLKEESVESDIYVEEIITDKNGQLEMNFDNVDKIINIFAGTNENAELSNFAERPFTPKNVNLPQIEYKNVEAAFQHAKLPFSDKITDQPLSIQSAKFYELTGSRAKQLGRQFKGLNIKEWDSNSELIMKNLIKQSFEQNPIALEELLETGDAILTHTQDKGKWGKLFPKILMEVRKELSNNLDISEKNRILDVSQELQELWDNNKEIILKNNPDILLEDLVLMANTNGMNDVIEFIKKCHI